MDNLGYNDLCKQGEFHHHRFLRFGNLDDIEKAIECGNRSLDLITEEHPGMAYRLTCLGNYYDHRHRRLGHLDDLKKSFEYRVRATRLTLENDPNLPTVLSNLGISYRQQYQQVGDVADLEKAIEHFSRALALTPNGHPGLPHHHAVLGASYGDRYQRMGDITDLEKAVEHSSRALALTPNGHPDLPDRHANLGVSYGERYRRMGDITDLEKAIECDSRALALTPDGHPDLPDHHAALGVLYTDRYQRMGDITDLEKAIECHSRALALTPDGHPDLPRHHAALGVPYGHRYQRMGDIADLEKATEHLSRALALTPDGHPDLPDRHGNLGVSYANQYQRMGDITDLEKAVEHSSRALALTPHGHPSLPRRHADLGGSYRERYRRMGDTTDLEKAIECDSRALALTPDGHPDLPDRHANLGASYTDRFQRMWDITALEKAIECHSRALALTPDGHPDLPRRHTALGVSYRDRYRLRWHINDLEKAIECDSRALALTPDGHPDLSLRRYKMAISYHEQYQNTGDPSHLHACLTSFRQSSKLSSAAPRDVFDNARRWANLAFEHPYLNPLEALREAMDLLPHFIWLGATTAQRYHDLVLIENLAVRASATAIRSSKCATGLEWLEHGRCIVWNQSLVLRSPLDNLEASHPVLAAQLHAVSAQLHHANSGSPPLESVDDAPKHRHRLAKEYSHLLAQARSFPGFEDFLQPTKATGLMRVARHGPVVVINCHQNDCDALVIVPGQDHIGHVSLPNYTQYKAQHGWSEIEQLLCNKSLRERGFRPKGGPVREPDPDIGSVLADLWNGLVKPVLEHLGYLADHTTDPLPHITWCPTGALSFLPLHAAGDYDQPRSRVFDYVVSSYTPTLTALLASAPTVENRAPRVLAVGQMATSGYSQLPGTARELASIKTHTQDRAEYSQLTGSKATAKAVLDAMEEHDWVHLACHAHQNVTDPTKSGFFLHGGRLDLAAINQRSFRNKGLAFLSACQTATGDEKLPDEAIHLASGMLMAGYRSVIATKWSVMDEDAPMVADAVYGQLMKDGDIGNGQAGRALHNAVAVLREKVGERNIARWASYIHIGS
ncbi:TPR-like protein, partial [Rhizoctonia solani]